ncbi:MAG TPA: sugar ABC transporter ATP-binding protein [Pseudonocardia sp.]|uniref:sugar ABC transporter ATP-binding protein n=1 Tax=Pseudonocardia sp. TaxID=60912 RepID=UPI002CC32F5D|nr:sugar ABC transporter ATP-binding protein [Pseudonocardia sp.]HTF52123.1 sugar ABC transporter ATP-binding protein [Pseudonocardia sp.]
MQPTEGSSVNGEPILRLEGVSKRFPGVHALREVSFELRPGEVHALVGENGAGKSTLIKVATGVYQADSGVVRYRGEPVAYRSPLEAQRAGISTIYQEVNLIPMMSVARNLFLNREPRRFGLIDSARMRREAQEILRDYGVEVNVAQPLRSLGLGAQQMVAIARAVQIEARVVVMDEPTSSLEQREVETLFGVVDRLRAAGIGIVYVSHRLDELYRICDRVTVMRDGRVVHVSDMAQLDRLGLISLMLGRDVADLRRDGTTAFSEHGGEHESTGEAPVLRARGLSSRHRLHEVSLEVRRSEVLGLGGLLGAGRSETAKAVVGALHTDAGSVEIAGTPVRRNSTGAAIRAGAVMLPEDRKSEGIIPNLSVRENIVLAALPRISRAGLVDRAKQDAIVQSFMDRLKIRAASPEQKVSELSGGNQQKVMLARWLCLNPKVLLLDEPTRGIDVGAKAEVQAVIDELAADGLAVVLISSDLEELIEGSDRVLVLREGRVVGELAGAQVSESELLSTLAGEPEAGSGDDH